MISTSNFQEWKNVIRQDWKLKIWSSDPTTTVALTVSNFEKLTRKVVFLFSFRKWNPPKNVAKSKWGRATVGFYKRITGRVCKLTKRLPVTLLDTLCSVELIKRRTPPWILLIWPTPWPAISAIWLGVRTVPVLSVATESRGASARSRTGRGAPEHRHEQGDATAWSTIECEETFEFVCLFVDVSFSSRINHRPGAACRVFKADMLRESKKIDMAPGQWDRRSKLAAVSHRSRTVRQSSTWERGKIGRRPRIHTEMTKTITIIDTRIRIHTSTSRSVKVKSTFGWPPPIDNVCEDPVQVRVHGSSATALSWSAGCGQESWLGRGHRISQHTCTCCTVLLHASCAGCRSRVQVHACGVHGANRERCVVLNV